LSQTTVLSIGAGIEQLPSIRIAQALGLSVIACDGDTLAPGKDVCDRFFPIDIKDEQAVIDLAKNTHIAFILPSPIGRYITTVGAVNDALGLKGISRQSALYCADKYLFHQKLKDHIPLAQQFLVTSTEEID
jgi:hypothetical protein